MYSTITLVNSYHDYPLPHLRDDYVVTTERATIEQRSRPLVYPSCPLPTSIPKPLTCCRYETVVASVRVTAPRRSVRVHGKWNFGHAGGNSRDGELDRTHVHEDTSRWLIRGFKYRLGIFDRAAM
jgi:hypothetical protein